MPCSPSHRYFVWTLVGRLRGPGGREDPHAWPLLAYLLTCCIYPLASSCAHTFSTMSTRARHICYFFDYAALSMYSLGEDGHVRGGLGVGGCRPQLFPRDGAEPWVLRWLIPTGQAETAAAGV